MKTLEHLEAHYNGSGYYVNIGHDLWINVKSHAHTTYKSCRWRLIISAWGASQNKSVTVGKALKTDERWIADETGRTLNKWMQTYSKDTADSKHKQFYKTWKRIWRSEERRVGKECSSRWWEGQCN